jgi:hypothetical protein
VHTRAALVGVGQLVPQAPQLAGSIAVLVQLPEQLVSPAPQLVTHAPAEHTWPETHARPHIPQFARSVCTSRQVPEQLVCPARHDTTQAPAVHSWPDGQVRPHIPQWLTSV